MAQWNRTGAGVGDARLASRNRSAGAKTSRTGVPEQFETYLEALDMWFSISVYCPSQDHFVAIFDMITEQKRAEEEREKLQGQLHQAQKMEVVGRLAGGVAHDFNNQLSVIFGYAEIALQKVSSSDPLHEDLNEIRKAARRSTDTTRQLERG